MATEQVNVKFLANTKDYVKGTDKATEAQDDLTDSIIRTDQAQDNLQDQNTALSGSLDDLSGSLSQTSEGLIDSATGMSGLGAAMTSIVTRVRAATASLSLFSKALIATGIGAAVAALVAIIAYWEEIKELIGFATEEIEDFTEAQERAAAATVELLDTQLLLLKALGAEKQLILKAELAILKLEKDKLTEQKKTLDFAVKFASVLGETEAEALARAGSSVEEYALLNEQLKLANANIKNVQQAIRDADAEAAALAVQQGEALNAPEVGGVEEFDEIAKIKEVKKAETDLEKFKREGLERLNKMAADFAQKRLDETEKQKQADADAANAKRQAASALTGLALSGAAQIATQAAALEEDDLKRKGNLLSLAAHANAAGAVVKAAETFPPPVPLFFISVGLIAATLATQLAQIKKSTKAGGGGGSVTSGISAQAVPQGNGQAVDRSSFATAAPIVRETELIPVLVTSDLTTEQQRVAVTADRSTLR